MNLATLSPDMALPSSKRDKLTLLSTLEEKVKRVAKDRLKRFYAGMYDWQMEFIEKTSEYYEACLCAANQIGKTRVGTTIDAYHLTGEYPDDYPGHKFDFAPMIWCLGYSMEKTRDLLQTALFGKFISAQEGFEGGLIPNDKIIDWESATGTVNAMRTVRVRHKMGTATVQFWSYSQGQHAIMGDVVDWVHVDEEPRDQAIRTQLLTRTTNGDKGKGGRIIYTLTPENGRTELVIQFMDTPSLDQFFMKKGWNDAPHMTPDKRKRMLAQFPDYQKKMRSEGDPMLGHGRIYDISADFVLCEPFEIPDFWKTIGGMDFGWDHPQAFVKLVRDPDNGIIYATNSWKASKLSANDAFGATSSWLKGVPVSWPHDGLQNEKGRDVSLQQKDHYVKAGFKLLPTHAAWHSGGLSVENGLYEILDLMRKGLFKIFEGQFEMLDELSQYHRNEHGKIVKVRDDILDALRYAYMMLRFAKTVGEIGAVAKRIVMPQPIRPMGIH